MNHPIIVINNIGKRYFNYIIRIPNGEGYTEKKGTAVSGQPIKVALDEKTE